MKHPYWARREIDALDPIHSAGRISHLSFEVRYGTGIFVHPLFSMAFARQVAVPAIARVLYRDGTGIILSQTAKRNNDTLVFFGLLFRHFGTPEGERIAAQIRKIHSRFPITNDLNLYTLATLACLPGRVGKQFTGREVLTDKENAALFHFWKTVGGQMGITDIPDSPDALLQWMIDYEATQFAHTKDGYEVTMALAQEFAERWFPKPLHGFAKNLFFATFDDALLQAHRLPPPSGFYRGLVKLAVRAFFGLKRLAPDPSERSLVEQFGTQN